MKIKAIVLPIFCLILATVAGTKLSYAQDDNTQTLSLEKFIELASSNDFQFEEILIDQIKLKYEKALKLPANDLVLSLKSQYNFVVNPDEAEPTNTISLSKLFPYTGTTLTAEYDSSFSKTTRKTTSEFTAYVSQPLAQNAFGKNTRLLDEIVGIEIEVANYQIIEAYEDYLATLIQLYYNWYSAYENVKTAENSYNENAKLLENMKEREKYKIALPVDVNKVSLQVAAKEESLITLKNKYNDYLNMVKESIRLENEKNLIPQLSSLYEEGLINFDKDLDDFISQSRTAHMLTLLEDKASLEIDKYADELLPSINLIAGYSISGSGHTIDNEEQLIYAGISLDWPLPGQVDRAEYKVSEIDLNKTQLSSESVRLRLKTDLKNLYDQIESRRKLIAIAEDKILYAQTIFDEDSKNYSLGRISLNDFIDAVNKLEENKFNKISQEIQAKRLIIEWLRLTDNLVTEINTNN